MKPDETPDWLDEALDRAPGEPVPEDFARRVLARLEELPPQEKAGSPAAPRLIPPAGVWRWTRRLGAAAAALLFLGLGFWLGRGRPELDLAPEKLESGPELAVADILDLYQNRELYGSMEILAGADAELAFADAVTGTWPLENEPGQEQQQ